MEYAPANKHIFVCLESLLTIFEVSRKKNLSTRDQNIYNLITSLTKETRNAWNKNENLKQRLQRAEKIFDCGSINLMNYFTPQARNIVQCHLRNANKKKFARRFTLDDKLFAFSLYKRSAAAYKYLANIFCLPSAESIRKISSQIPLEPGLCDSIFESLELHGKRMKDPKDRLCSLMCDDVEIEISILFDEKKNKVEGYVDNGTERKPLLADHATIWLAKGINPKNKKNPWKQALVFSFCKGSSSVPEIKNMYTEVVRRLHGIGFTVVASVCDQGATNEKAMKELLKESKNKALKDNKNYCENNSYR